MREYETKRRCKWRDKRISWCVKLGKFCNSPYEYEKCPHYEARSRRKQKRAKTWKGGAEKADGNRAGVASHIIPPRVSFPVCPSPTPQGSVINNMLHLAESHETDGG